LSIGVLSIVASKLKKQLFDHIEKLNQVLFKCIKKKIDQTNHRIEEEVESILAFITKDPIENVEELRSIQDFIQHLDEKLLGIRGYISDVMGKMGLLE